MNEQPELKNISELPIVAIAYSVYGAVGAKNGQQCWMCEQNPQSNPYAFPALVQELTQPAKSKSKLQRLFRVLLEIYLIVVMLIGIGMAVQDPGALPGFGILVLPAFLITGVRALWQFRRDGTTSGCSLPVSLLTSFALTTGIFMVPIAAGIILQFVMCLTLLSRLAGGPQV